MAAITQVNANDIGAKTLTKTALSASDTLTYTPGSNQYIMLINPSTTAAVTVTFTGSGATSIAPKGYGGTISTSSGKAVTVPISGAVILELDDISAFLVGNVTVTGGTGVDAYLFNL